MKKITFTMHGLRADDEYIKCSYFMQDNKNILISAYDFKHLPKELGEVKNNTDIISDYMCDDFVEIKSNSPFYRDVLKAFLNKGLYNNNRLIRYSEKKLLNTNLDFMKKGYLQDIEYAKNKIAEIEKQLKELK